MKMQQVFFMYCAQWEAEPGTWTWSHPGATLGSLLMTTFSLQRRIHGNPWGFVHFYKFQLFNLQVNQNPCSMLSKYSLKVKLPWHFSIIDKNSDLQGSGGVLRWAPVPRWLRGYHVLGHVSDAFLCLVSLCHSGCCPCSCCLVGGTSPSAALWVTTLISGLLPLVSSLQGGRKHTGYPWNWHPRCEQDVELLILWAPWCISLLRASAAYENPSSPTCFQGVSTDVIALEPDEMHCLAEGSLLVASWFAGSTDLQSPKQACSVFTSPSLSLWVKGNEIV